MDWFESLALLRAKPSRRVAGIMSGTSVDSIDVALCEIERAGLPAPGRAGAKAKLLSFYSQPFSAALRSQIIGVRSLGVRELAEAHAAIGDAFAQAFLATCESLSLAPSDVDLIGSHGQTVYHHSSQQDAVFCTLQLGDGDRIAELTGRPVISDFRARDVAAGGHGAPLTPYADVILYGSGEQGADERRAVLNLGGIANATILDSDPSKVYGFDTGPANAPLDRVARLVSQGKHTHDINGDMARSGKVNDAVLKKLLADDAYLKKAPPKSTGFEMYGDDFVARVKELHGKVDNDLLATMTEFVAQSIGKAFQDFVKVKPPVTELIVAGGGGQNRFLIERIQAAMPAIKVVSSDTIGVPSRSREAMAFAILANDALMGYPGTLPSVTGARRPAVLGKLSFPS